MMSGIVVRLAGVSQPETRIFRQEVITIGTAPDCDLCINAPEAGLPPESVLLTIHLQDEHYRLGTVETNSVVTRHGEPVAVGEAIRDGDTYHFGTTGIRLRFFSITDQPSLTQSLRLGSAVLASAEPSEAQVAASRRRRLVPRTDVAIVFVKQLLRELVAEIPRRKLYAILGLMALILFTIIYFNTLSYLEGRRNNKAIVELKETMGATKHEIDKLREELQLAREESEVIRGSLSLPQKVVNSYGQGVCLIYGSYSFVDPRVGREVRFKEPGSNENPIGPDGTINLSAGGNGEIYEVEFLGTGFLSAKGLILTNRHVVQAWEDDDLASLIKMRGFRPRLKELAAYFPGSPRSFSLRILEMLQDQDVALCSFDQGEFELPVLPLDENGETIASGQPVVLIGYPAGLEGLISRVYQGGRTGSRRFGNLPYKLQLNELAANSKIRPQSTQGHISDVTPQLVYDARTDAGGSGGPVFGANGKVIGINQAVLLNSQVTTNFGVPIKYGLELLKRHQNPQQASQTPSDHNLSGLQR